MPVGRGMDSLRRKRGEAAEEGAAAELEKRTQSDWMRPGTKAGMRITVALLAIEKVGKSAFCVTSRHALKPPRSMMALPA